LEVIRRLKMPAMEQHAFTWIVDFPLFERADESEEWIFAHHPFTAPHPDNLPALMAREYANIRALHYDAVYNGYELGSGSIRITDPEVQLRVLEAMGIPREDAERRFGFLLTALRSGAPPHGGFAVGFDRVVMLLAGVDNLRDVIAFPKTTAARALFEDSPTPVDSSELKSLGLLLSDQ
jgi:aspartyl-tRNA synthetase